MIYLVSIIIHIKAQLKSNLLMSYKTNILTLLKKLMIKILNLKLVILLQCQPIKYFCKRLCSELV